MKSRFSAGYKVRLKNGNLLLPPQCPKFDDSTEFIILKDGDQEGRSFKGKCLIQLPVNWGGHTNDSTQPGWWVFKEGLIPVSEPSVTLKDNNSQEIKKGSVVTNKQVGFFEMLQEDLQEAGYRVAAEQLMDAVQSGLVLMAQSEGLSSDEAAAFAKVMQTKLGRSVLEVGLGYGLTYMPGIDNENATKLAKEFRVGGLASTGNDLALKFRKFILPGVKKVFETLPSVEKTRIAEVVPTPSPVETEEVTEDETSKMPEKTISK